MPGLSNIELLEIESYFARMSGLVCLPLAIMSTANREVKKKVKIIALLQKK